MGKQSFNLQKIQFLDFLDFSDALFLNWKANSSHPCIQRQMNMYGLSLACRFLRQSLSRAVLKDSRTNLFSYQQSIIFLKCVPQYQDWFMYSRFPQLPRLLCGSGGEAPDILIALHSFRNSECSMPVPISLNHGHHLSLLRKLPVHFLKILRNRVQRYRYLCSTVFLHFYQLLV